MTFYDTLVYRPGTCPEECTACVEACAQRPGGKGLPVIERVRVAGSGYQGLVVCNQCSQPQCAEICPVAALKRDADGVVRLDASQCVGCGLCTLACPYGGLIYDEGARQVAKCDYCGGQPLCVGACPTGALSWASSRPVVNFLQKEDPFTHGTSLCSGCPAELALRFMLKVLGQDIVLFITAGCAGAGALAMQDCSRVRVAEYSCLMTNVASSMTGVKRYLRRAGKDAPCVAFVGDGAAADISFQPLSGACERGENLIFICYDNEAYMNTGIQRSGTTPLGAWTTTTQVGSQERGKKQPPKNLPLLMAFQGAAYVATATISHLEDYAQKLTKARRVDNGLAYIHLLSPCPTGWRSEIDTAIEISRLAVESNYFPLWEAENGQFRFTYQPKQVQPLTRFTSLTRRFAHLGAEEVASLQELVDRRYEQLKKLVELHQGIDEGSSGRGLEVVNGSW